MSYVCNFNITKMMKYGVCWKHQTLLTSRSTCPAQEVWDTKVDNIKPQLVALFSLWLQCYHYLRPTRTRSTSCRRSLTKKSRDCTFLTRYRAHRPYSGIGSLWCSAGIRQLSLVSSLPEQLDEKVAYLDLPALTVELTVKPSPVEGVYWAG